MSQYRCAPDTDEHINATILGHGYYLFADQVGHDIAGNVLTYIPYALPPAPSFNDVAYWFSKRSEELYGQTVARRGQPRVPHPGRHRHPDPRRQGLRLRTAAHTAVPPSAQGLREQEASAPGVLHPIAADAARARPDGIDQSSSPRGPRAESRGPRETVSDSSARVSDQATASPVVQVGTLLIA